MTSFVTLVAEIVKLLKYTDDAYNAVRSVIQVWEEQTGEVVTDAQWASIDALLRSADDYVAGDG